MNRRTLLALAAILPAAFAAAPAFAGKAEIFTGIVDGVGAGGYDTVSYFTGTPVEGSKEFSTKWKDAEWRFASAANRDAFTAAPEKYAPQYGGYCAFALSKGALAKGEPTAWTVNEGKLYLNYSEAVRDNWRSDIPGNVAAANGNWPKVLE
jgi:YHS domain